jgi:uncharacterized Rmd1/YagE family protein
MSEGGTRTEDRFTAKAILLGRRIDLRALTFPPLVAEVPRAVAAGSRGTAVLFRYGAVVLFDVAPGREEEDFLAAVREATDQLNDPPEVEAVDIRLRPDGREQVEQGMLYLRDRDLQRMQVVAEVLARSTLLARYEARIGESFNQVQPAAERMHRRHFPRRQARLLFGHVGDALLSQQMMIGHAEVMDRPEILWEHPELETLYNRLEEEYELRDRHRALKAKLDLVYRTAQTSLDMLQDRRTLRVEWYIVILIVIEIIISLYELFVLGPH